MTNSRSYNNFIDFTNSLRGDNIYGKFVTFLETWKDDVSSTINLNIDGNNVQIFISYILDNFQKSFNYPQTIKTDLFEIGLDIPKTISTMNDVFPIYDIIQYINIINYNNINLNGVDYENKKIIIDNLPPDIYNKIFKEVTSTKNVIFSLDNPRLSNLKFNFYTIEPYIFLYNLIRSYDENFFRDVIYILSRKIDGQILLNSTISDINYFLEKHQEEISQQKSAFPLDI